jgi:hypothetical protein
MLFGEPVAVCRESRTEYSSRSLSPSALPFACPAIGRLRVRPITAIPAEALAETAGLLPALPLVSHELDPASGTENGCM